MDGDSRLVARDSGLADAAVARSLAAPPQESAASKTVVAALVAATAALFAFSIGFEFVRFDDPAYTFACPFVRGGLSWSNIAAAFTDFTHGGVWMPLTYVSYMVDVSLFGGGAAGHHVINVVLHALNAVLLFRLLMDIARSHGGGRSNISSEAEVESEPRFAAPVAARHLCALAAAIWAVHPLRVEPVCWIAARKELLWAAFALLGLIAMLRGRFALTALFCVLACLSKPTAMCFPVLALAVGGIASGVSGFAFATSKGRSKSRIVAATAVCLAAAFTAFVAAYSQTHAAGYDARSLFTASFWERLAAAAHAFFTYVGELLLPFGLHADVRRVSPLPLGDPRLWLGSVLFMVFVIWAVFRRSRAALWSAVFFVAALAPPLGVFGSFGREARADRFLYVPSMAVSLLLLACAARCPNQGMAARSAASGTARALCVFGVIALIPATLLLVPSWRNDYTLFSRVLAHDPEHPRALAHVASEECARFRNFDAGIAHFRKSLALQYAPNVAAELAYALAARGRPEDAAEARQLAAPVAANPRADRVGIARKALDLLENMSNRHR